MTAKINPNQNPTVTQLSPLTFAPTWNSIQPSPSPAKVSNKSYWLWQETAPGYEAYKNDVLIRYQDALTSCGIPQSAQRLYVQQLTQENGSLEPTLTGGTDRGYSFGIGQWNTSPIKAKAWLQRHPEQATLDWQIVALAQSSCDKYTQYNGNVRRAIVAHNCPQCSAYNAKPSVCTSVDSVRKIGGKWSCYYDDEVNGNTAIQRFALR